MLNKTVFLETFLLLCLADGFSINHYSRDEVGQSLHLAQRFLPFI